MRITAQQSADIRYQPPTAADLAPPRAPDRPEAAPAIERVRLPGQTPATAPAPTPLVTQDGLLGFFENIGRGLAGVLIGAAQSLAKAARCLLEGRPGDALRALVSIPFNAVAHASLRAVGAAESFASLHGRGRPLADAERQMLTQVFGRSIDLDKLRVVQGNRGLLTVGAQAITVGNTIVVANGSTLSPALLAHEAVHVWQYQRGGDDYLLRSLEAQGSREGYEIAGALSQGARWGDLNTEQQASLVEQALREGHFDGPGGSFATVQPDARWLLRDHAPVVGEAVSHLRDGRGTERRVDPDERRPKLP